MQEEDTCRICSFPGDSEQPLFHPCKCSGTIRYIHQDCLTTWLAHSKKKTCDVCKYQYSFTKVYSSTMPKHIPFVLFLRRFAQQLLWACLLGLRGVMVAVIWLAFLPYVTVWTWRFYFIMGENIAWWINDRPRPAPSSVFSSYYAHSNTTDFDENDVSNSTALNPVVIYPLLRALSSDIFTGQIIASLIVFAFLGVFLLREWIIQNARPGVFEDNAIEHVQEAVDGGREEDVPVEGEQREDQEERNGPVNDGPFVNASAQTTRNSSRSDFLLLDGDDADKGVGSSTIGIMFDASDPTETRSSEEEVQIIDPVGPPPRRRRRIHGEAHPRHERPPARESRSHSWNRQPRNNRRLFSSSRSSDSISPEGSGSTLPIETSVNNSGSASEGFQFTFAIERPKQLLSEAAPTSSGDSVFTFHPTDPEQLSESHSPSSHNNLGSEDFNAYVSSSGRPQLHSSALDGNDLSYDSLNFDALQRQDTPPFPSPGIASYRAPEEISFQAGPSQPIPGPSTTANVDQETASSASTAGMEEEDDADDYFRDPSESDDEANHAPPPPNVEADAQARHIVVAEPEPRIPEQPPPDAQVQDEEMNANMDDDIDGALEEAIGMRGPITTVYQNAALMIFVLDTTIGLGVWLPFTVGKTTALLSLEPVRILHLLHWPIRIIRIVTDPLVDFLFFMLRHTALPIVRRLANAASSSATFALTTVSRLPIALPSNLELGEKVRMKISAFVSQQPATIFNFSGSRSPSEGDNAFVAVFDKAASTPLGQVLEPHFANLGKSLREHAVAFKASWIELSYGDGSVNRVFAIALGYLAFGFVVALYLNILNVGNVQSAGRAIRSAIRQQLIVIKVAIFIVVELVVFPLGCGVLLDICTLPLLPDTSISTRLAFLSHAPVTATFYDWMIGTMFMYQFAVLLSDCRKIMRTGAMWFIKDPQDQNFHPIRDILDRPALVQLRKLVISAVMYSVVVACSAGGIVFCLKLWQPTLLPLRWNMRQPLSEIPIDLLLVHLALPVTLRYFRPRKLARKIANIYWRWGAHQLRLTSYMFGERRPTEELASTWSLRSVLSFLPGVDSSASKEEPRWEGTFRRVPAADNIALPKEIRATVAVNEEGSPVDEASKRLMDLQNAEADKAKRDVKEDYVVVYLPPYFKQRIMLFIASLWIVGSISVVAAFAAPIVIGRAFFKLFTDDEVHDAYSFVAGFYLLWGSFIVGKTLDRMDKRRQRSSGDEPRAEWSVYVFKQSILWLGKSAWLLFWLGVVIPILIALVMEVYLIHPMKLIVNPDTSLRIRVVDQWAIGLIFTKIAMTSMDLRPATRIDAAIKRFTQGGWRHPDALAATFEIIAPITTGLITVLVFPMVLVAGLQYYIPSAVNDKSLFLYVYPGIFVLACIARTAMLFESLLAGWTQSIRDSEFLVEMQLRNLDPSPAVNPVTSSTSDVSTGTQSTGTTTSDVEAVAQ